MASFNFRKKPIEELKIIIKEFEEIFNQSTNVEEWTRNQLVSHIYDLLANSQDRNICTSVLIKFFEGLETIKDISIDDKKFNICFKDEILYKNGQEVSLIELDFIYLKTIYRKYCEQNKIIDIFSKFQLLKYKLL